MRSNLKSPTLNVLLLWNKQFIEYAEALFNPRNAMMVDFNDGYTNSSYMIQRDSLINVNSYTDIGKEAYTAEQILAIKKAIGR